KGIDFGQIANFIPTKLLKLYGLVKPSEIDIVIDAAGFAYSDQWGVSNCRELSSSSKIWKKNNTKFIMLPQALGPFENEEIQKYVKIWAKNADLVFAREADSYQYLT